MSQQSKQELVRRLRPRSLKGSRAAKTKILDEFVTCLGQRKNATFIRMFDGEECCVFHGNAVNSSETRRDREEPLPCGRPQGD